jgi:hypothetical protein
MFFVLTTIPVDLQAMTTLFLRRLQYLGKKFSRGCGESMVDGPWTMAKGNG